jgi:hypothetical protein
MNPGTEEYIKLYSVWKFANQIDSDSDLVDRLDALWGSFSEEEVDWVEKRIQEKIIPSAPQSLDLVDVEVKLGQGILPRKNFND